MTWSIIRLTDTILVKPYRGLEKKCTAVAQNIIKDGYYSDYMMVNLNGKPISVIDSILYLMIRVREKDVAYKLATQMSIDDAKQYTKKLESNRRKEKTVVSQHKTYRKVSDTDKLSFSVIDGLGDNPEYALISGDIKVAIANNPSLMGQLIACGIVLASMVTQSIEYELSITPYSLHSLVVRYWATKNSSISTTLNSLTSKIDIKKTNGPKVRANQSFEDCVKAHFKSEKAYEVAVKYLEDMEIDIKKQDIKKDSVPVAFYNHIEEFVEAFKQQSLTDKWIKHICEKCKEEILDFLDCDHPVYRYLGRRNINKWVYATLSSSVLVSNYLNTTNFTGAILYALYLKTEKGINIVSEHNITSLMNLTEFLTARITYEGMLFSSVISRGALPKALTSIDKLQTESKSLNERLNTLMNDCKCTKQQLRKLQKEDKQNLIDRDYYKQQVDDLKEQYSGKLSKSDLDKANNQIAKLEALLAKSREKDIAHSRELVLQSKEVERCREELEQAQADYSSICEQLDKANSRILSLEFGADEVAMQPYIKALNLKRIAIVGGDRLASKAISMGLNARHFKEHYNGIGKADLSDMDLCIICTDFIGHSLMAGASDICKTNNVKILYHNKSGVETLIRTAFETVYS